MPVLIVSEKTWPHDGFSRKRSTRPSSSVTTIPNSSGFVDRLQADRDRRACFSRWNSTSASRSKSQSASPEMTRNVSSSVPAASRTEPAVPSGRLLDRVLDVHAERLAVAEVAADRLRQERDGDDDVLEAVVRSSSRMCSMHGLPTIGTIGFGWFEVSGRRRVPSPPAMTTAFIASRALASVDTTYEHAATSASTRPIQKSQSGQSVAGRRDDRQAERRVEDPGRDLAEQAHVEVDRRARARRGSRRAARRRGRGSARAPRTAAGRSPEQDDRGVDHEPVGERVGDLPELGLDVPAAGEEAVDLVGDRRRARRGSRPSSCGRRRPGASAR